MHNRLIATICILSLTILALCFYAYRVAHPVRKVYTAAAAESSAIAEIRGRLAHPANAQFSNIVIAKSQDSVFLILGDVDAANGFGAYWRAHFGIRVSYINGDLVYFDHVVIQGN